MIKFEYSIMSCEIIYLFTIQICMDKITHVTIILKRNSVNVCQFNRVHLYSFNIVVTQFASKCYFRTQYSYIHM